MPAATNCAYKTLFVLKQGCIQLLKLLLNRVFVKSG